MNVFVDYCLVGFMGWSGNPCDNEMADNTGRRHLDISFTPTSFEKQCAR